MARSAGVSIENNFSKGLITEVTGVNSPENSVVETQNIVYDRRGRAFPRQGFNYEDSHVQQAVNVSGVRNEFIWDTFASEGTKTFVVVQLGYMIRFFEPSSTSSLSSGLKSFSVDLRTYKVASFSNTTVQNNLASFSTGLGYLLIAHPNCETLYVKYNEGTDTITVNEIEILIRDFEGVDDGLDIDERPTTLSNAHRYNLLNQGWYATARRSVAGGVLNHWSNFRSDYPANTDVWWYYTRPTREGIEIFDETIVDARAGFFGNTPAAKGHYILTAMSTNRTALSGNTATETTSNGYRPAVVAFFMGRAFYAGVPVQKYSSTIYFTQIIERDEQLGHCYQANDPTSKETFDLLASDGGTIKIQDIANIIDLRVVGQSLFVFASNGVWAVTGTDIGPFRATDYSVSKVSSFPCISKTSIVDVGGTPVWWNYEGIFTLQKDQIGLSSEVTNLTLSTIQSFYDTIPPGAKLLAKGWFNDQESLVYWIYRDDSELIYEYNKILVFDIGSGAFYPLDIPETSKKISGVFAIRSASESFTETDVISSGGLVQSVSSDQVVIDVSAGLLPLSKVFKFLTIEGSDVTFSEITDSTYLDWGIETYSYSFITGYRIRGELVKQFQTNYLTVVTETVTDSSCYVQGVWDYTNSHVSGRYTNPQQVYRTRGNRDYQLSRLMMRGNGRSLQFRFFGESGKPFIVVGWSGFETVDGEP